MNPDVDDNLEVYPGASDELVDDEARRTARNSALVWRVIRYLTVQQLRDLEAERTELDAILARATERLRA